jgi:hypothetical protein
MEGAVAAVLKMYQVTLDDKNIAELGIMLIWATRATNAFYSSEVIDVLEKPSATEQPSASEDCFTVSHAAIALGERIRTCYGLLLKLVRDDGVSTNWFDSQPRSLLLHPFCFMPSSTIVELAHPEMAEHVRECLFNVPYHISPLLAPKTELDANTSVFKACFEHLETPSLGHRSSLRNYASNHSFSQLKKVHLAEKNDTEYGRLRTAMEPHADMVRLLCTVMNDEDVFSWCCNDSDQEVYARDNANMIADCAPMWFDPGDINDDDPITDWV